MQLQTIVTTLSTGPVGPSDMVGGTNASLVMQTCRAGDGLLLRPDRPATTVDSAFVSAVWGSAAWGAPRSAAAAAAGRSVVTTGDGTIVTGVPGLHEVAVPQVSLTYSSHGHGAYRCV